MDHKSRIWFEKYVQFVPQQQNIFVIRGSEYVNHKYIVCRLQMLLVEVGFSKLAFCYILLTPFICFFTHTLPLLKKKLFKLTKFFTYNY